MKKQIEQVKEFREKFNLPVNSRHHQGNVYVNRHLHEKLIQEELEEMKDAADLTEKCDAIIDQMYLLIGYALDLGVADRLEDMFTEVHESNMSKLSLS